MPSKKKSARRKSKERLVTEKALHVAIDGVINLSSLFELEKPCVEPECSDFLKIFEAAHRINLRRLKVVHDITDGTPDDAVSALEVMRSIIEDYINLEYMMSVEDVEGAALAERFFDFKWVQLAQDIEYYASIGLSFDKNEVVEEIKAKSGAMLEKYPDEKTGFVLKEKTHTPANQWLRGGVEKLIQGLKDSGNMEQSKAEMLMRSYVLGSRRLHLNPENVLAHLEGHDTYNTWPIVDAFNALLVSSMCQAWILDHYCFLLIDAGRYEWDDYSKVHAKLEEIINFLASCMANLTSIEPVNAEWKEAMRQHGHG
ncbi:hypothetical protein [Amycolatopsis sp. CA-126428]|uniref:hypothetical protein n=1 Tax=Amycolatopsis sp. CA-126428 TaxID=2073158 RepID=UPI0011B060E6|nr:hypothetical protein [Amycolatopsis sp. CA-126428]